MVVVDDAMKHDERNKRYITEQKVKQDKETQRQRRGSWSKILDKADVLVEAS